MSKHTHSHLQTPFGVEMREISPFKVDIPRGWKKIQSKHMKGLSLNCTLWSSSMWLTYGQDLNLLPKWMNAKIIYLFMWKCSSYVDSLNQHVQKYLLINSDGTSSVFLTLISQTGINTIMPRLEYLLCLPSLLATSSVFLIHVSYFPFLIFGYVAIGL